MSWNNLSTKRGASVLDARPSLNRFSGVSSASAVEEFGWEPSETDSTPTTAAPKAVVVVIPVDSEAWVERYLRLAAESDFREELDQLQQDKELDISYESQVCWEENGMYLMAEWEKMFYLTMRVESVCFQQATPMAMLPPVGRPGFMWSLHSGCEEIDQWFLDKRTERECEEGLEVLELEWEYGLC